MKKYPLLGRIYTVSDGREKYKNYLNQYKALADKYTPIYCQEYKNDFNDIDAVIEGAVDLGDSMIRQIVEENCIAELVSKGYYTYNVDTFLDQYYLQKYYVLGDRFDIVLEKYEDIVYTQEQKRQMRAERKAGRSRMYGMGFGVKGAVKAKVTSDVFNLGTGALHSGFNALGNAASSANAALKKSNLFNDNSTLNTIAQGFYQSIYNLSGAMTDFMIRNAENKPEPITNSDRQDARIILDNLRKFRLNDNDVIDQVYKALYLDPFNQSLYIFIIDKFGDPNGEVEALAEEFGISLEEYKLLPIQKMFSEINFNDKMALMDGKNRLVNACELAGVDPIFYLEKIDTEEKRLDYEAELKERIKTVSEKADEDFTQFKPIKERVAAYEGGSLEDNAEFIGTLLSELDGDNGYVEWILYDTFSDVVINLTNNVVKRITDPEAAVNAINTLLQTFDDEIANAFMNGDTDVKRNVALNVLRAAIHGVAIKGVDTIFNIEPAMVRLESVEHFEKARDIYQQQKEKDLKNLKRYERVIYEGADQGNALANALYAGSLIEANQSFDELTESCLKTAAEKYFPTAMLAEGMALSRGGDITDALAAYYYLLMVMKMEIRSDISISEADIFNMCKQRDESLKTLDNLIMFISEVSDQPDTLGLRGYIMCNEVSSESKISIFGPDKTFKGDTVISGLISKDGIKQKKVHKNDDIVLTVMKKDLGFLIEQDDSVYLKTN